MAVTTPSRDPRMGTKVDQGVNPETGATPVGVQHADQLTLQDLVKQLHDVQMRSTTAIEQMSRQLHSDITVGMIRQAAALGDTRARAQAEALYARGYGGGYDLMAGLESPTAGQTSSTNGSLAGGSSTQTGGAGVTQPGAGQGGPPGGGMHPTTLSATQMRASSWAGQHMQQIFSPAGKHARGTLAQRAGMGVGRSIANSGGTMEGFMNALKMESPWVAAAAIGAETGEKAYGWGLEQTEAGRAYERIEGPMSTYQQQMERARSKVWRFRSLGESSGESEEQFSAATRLGLRGSDRSFALQQMYRQSTRLGMDPEQEAEVLRLAVQHAGTSLSNLTDSLTLVSNAAQDAHVNADTARDSFIQMMQTTLQTGMGPAATTLATATTTMMTAMGPQMQGADASGMFSQGRMLALAGQSGMTPFQFLGANITSQGAAFAQSSDRFTGQALQGVLGPAYQVIVNAVQQAGPQNIKNDPNLAGQLAQRIIQSGALNGVSPTALMGVVAQLGGVQTTDPVQCVQWIINYIAGMTASNALAKEIGQSQTMGSGAANRQRGSNPNLLTSGQIGAKPATDTASSLSSEFAGVGHSAGDLAHNLTHGSVLSRIGHGALDVVGLGNPLVGDTGSMIRSGVGGVVGSAEHVLNPWYHGEKGSHTLGAIQGQEKSGKTSPVVEAVYKKILASGMNPDTTMVEIFTGKGAIEIPFSEAVKSYPNSIASGQFTIKGERYKSSSVWSLGIHHGDYKYKSDKLSGESLAQLGITGDASQGTTSGAAAEQSKGAPKDAKSSSAVDYGNNGKGSQLFDLTPAAAAVLTPLVQGSQSQGAVAASQGTPPPISTDASNPARLVS